MLESEVEARLRTKVEKIGGKAYKFISDGNRGVPDRLICLPNGRAIFVETKRPKGGKVSKLQAYRIKELQALGFDARVINTYELVDNFIQEITNEI